MDLGGWNFVSAVALDQVNAGFARQRDRLFHAFELTGPIVASGTYGDWSVVEGGSGKLLAFELAVEDGTLQAQPGPIGLAGAVLCLEVRLDLLADSSGGSAIALNLQAVTLRGMRNVPPGLGNITAAALGAALAENFVRHAEQLRVVLATIAPLGPDAPQWLALASPDFAYVAPEGGTPSVAVFANPDPGPTPALKLDPKVVGPDGFGLAISRPRFMANVFAPALATALGTQPEHLAIDATGRIANADTFDMQDVSTAGRTYHPEMRSLQAVLTDDRIGLTFGGACNLGMGISMTFTGSSFVALGMPGPGTLAFAQVGSQSFDKDVDIPWYDHLLDVAGGVAEVILDVTVHEISNELSEGIARVASGSELLHQAPSVVRWFGEGGFIGTEAGLADAFWLHGKHA